MADIYLNVGYVSQLKIGAGENVRKDPTGCWYASAEMVGYYFEQGPRLGDPKLFVKKVGTNKDGTDMIGHMVMDGNQWEELMVNEGLEAIELPVSKTWTADALAELLRIYGPIIFAWKKVSARSGNSYGHISVLIGAEGSKNEVVIHDPEDKPNFRLSVEALNAQLMWRYSKGKPMLRRADGEYRMKNGLTTAG